MSAHRKAKIAIRHSGYFFVVGSYTDAMRHQARMPDATLESVWEVSDAADYRLGDIVGRLGSHWYVKRR